MEQFIVRCIGFVFDWVPYAVGRIAVVVLSWGNLRCEPWRPLVWSSEFRTKPWWERLDGEIIVTRWGARWIGAIVMAGLILAFFAGVLRVILNMYE